MTSQESTRRRRATARALWLVAGRELRESARRRSTWVSLALVFIGGLALVIVPDLLDGDDRRTVATAGSVPEWFATGLDEAQGSTGLRTQLVDAADRSSLETEVRDGRADAGVDFGTDPPTVVVQTVGDDGLTTLLGQVVSTETLRAELVDRGLSTAEVTAALTGAAPEVRELQTDQAGRSAVAFVASLVLYLLLLLLTTAVASGVAIEKSKRISEVLLAVVEPTALLFGKIVGVGLVGVMTLAAGALPVAADLLLGGELPPGTGVTLAGTAAWFVLGLALYLSMAAGLGALVDRQEQVGSAMAPLSILLIAAYFAGVGAADTPLGAVLSIVPFTSPMVTPARLALGEAGPAELVASLATLVATVLLVGRLSTVVYRRAIVRTGRRLTLGEVLRRS
jgi:ABC-2 type transport system permease protein